VRRLVSGFDELTFAGSGQPNFLILISSNQSLPGFCAVLSSSTTRSVWKLITGYMILIHSVTTSPSTFARFFPLKSFL
jgi:hypothetical protein